MRTLCAFVVAAGFAVGLVTVSSLTSTSMARIAMPDPVSSANINPQAEVVLVQSSRQRREIEEFLNKYKFGDPDYVRSERPSLFVEACRNEKKYLLMFDDNGEYFGRRHLGECQARPRVVPLEDLRYWLEDRNYTNIRFTDRSPPERVAEACLNKQHYTIRFDATGKATPRRSWFSSQCRNNGGNGGGNGNGDDRPTDDPTDTDLTMSKASITIALRRRGYRKISYDRYFDESRLAEACMGLRKFRLFLDARSGVKARRAVGFCKVPQRFADITPPRPDLDNIDTESNSPLEPETCQEILNWYQYRTPIIFESASDNIRESSRPLLETIVQSVDRCPRTQLRIEGHTDSIGPARFNRKLSAERADAVRRFLIRRRVPSRRIRVEGFGEKYPVTGNLIERDRARNRRIDLVLEWGSARDLRLARASDDDDRQ